jgi:protein-disulfide isomerase
MSTAFRHLLIATGASAAFALVSACTRSGSAADNAATSGAKTPASTPATVSSGGATKTTGATPHDSISDLADRGRILGDSTAPVWVIMASDFQCPFCKQWETANYARIVKDYVKTGKARLAFLNMPLSMHRNALPASEAAMCASVQGKFWQMHDTLFASQEQWEVLPDPRAKFDSISKAIGVDMPSWRSCMAQHATLALIDADRDRARQAGVNSTPTFFVGNRTLMGADQDVGAAIDAALKTRSK